MIQLKKNNRELASRRLFYWKDGRKGDGLKISEKHFGSLFDIEHQLSIGAERGYCQNCVEAFG